MENNLFKIYVCNTLWVQKKEEPGYPSSSIKLTTNSNIYTNTIFNKQI